LISCGKRLGFFCFDILSVSVLILPRAIASVQKTTTTGDPEPSRYQRFVPQSLDESNYEGCYSAHERYEMSGNIA
jgi:hypothetical protein